MRLTRRRCKAATLTETVVGMGVSMFLLGYLGFLTLFSGRNMANIHAQMQGQANASMADERCVTLLREACYFDRFSQDEEVTTPLRRIRFAVIQPDSTLTTRVLAYNATRQQLRYYLRESDVTFGSGGEAQGTPAQTFEHIADFFIEWQTQYRLRMQTCFSYSGFALHSSSRQNQQKGSYTTDVIARNHFLGKGVENYAEDSSSSGPASL